VHGDLSPGNALFTGDDIRALVDVEALGAGSRLHDLAALIGYAHLNGAGPGVLDELIRHTRRLARPGELPVSLGSCLLGLLAFGVDHWPHDVDAVAVKAARLIAALSR
jgi:thiamine kinase-like enzyme